MITGIDQTNCDQLTLVGPALKELENICGMPDREDRISLVENHATQNHTCMSSDCLMLFYIYIFFLMLFVSHW